MADYVCHRIATTEEVDTTGTQASNKRLSRQLKIAEPVHQDSVQLIYELSALTKQLMSSMIDLKETRKIPPIGSTAIKLIIFHPALEVNTCTNTALQNKYLFSKLFLSTRSAIVTIHSQYQ